MDDLGDRLKAYETQVTSRKLLPGVPVYARIDGRSFSKFTRDMIRPFDSRLHDAMVSATQHLVDQSGATIGYTASDEISLGWALTDHKSQMLFDGKLHKLHSVLASMATVAFVRAVAENFEDADKLLDKMPHFDARVMSVPNLDELANCFLWRNWDCTKNSISMAASHFYGHQELHGKNSAEKQEMLWQKGQNFNDYPSEFKRGTFVRRRKIQQEFNPVSWALIPLAHRPPLDELLLRTQTVSYDLPPLSKINNRVQVLFDDAEPNSEYLANSAQE